LDISNLVRYWNANNTFAGEILDNFNQGTAYAPWVRIPVNGKKKYVNPNRLKEYIARETSSIPKHLIFGPMDRANGRFSYQTGRAKFASVESKTFREIFEKNDQALTKKWFMAVNEKKKYSNSQVFVSYKGQQYQVNKEVLKKNQSAISAEIRDKDNYGGSLSISDDCMSKIYNARSNFNANWFVLPSNRRVKPNWPVYMNKNQRMYLDVDQYGLYNIGKINDPQFGATLKTCAEKV
jgi:succinate dehydrogenase flavin-adding protein (antitoxin of CptAB toxin-antitoxin module)